MSGQYSKDLESADEPLDTLREPTSKSDDRPAAVDEDAMWGESADDGGDPFAEPDGLVVLRRLAQEASKPDKIQSRFRVLRGRTRHDNKHHIVNDKSAQVRRGLTVHPVEGSEENAHTPNWCPAEGKNILMRANRSCPACGQVV